LAAAFLLVGGCGDDQARQGPYSPAFAVSRDIPKAEALYQQARPLLTSDAAAAEKLLRDALGFDLFNGCAHNDLGVLLLAQGKLYDAAAEFEWARKLLPGHPEPRTNLAITLERGGKHQEAMDAARAALEIRAGDLEAMECLALIQVREGVADATTLSYLDAIIQRAADLTWNAWAKGERITLETALQKP
jgi:tetratricopeptide (TPR) repeat protein